MDFKIDTRDTFSVITPVTAQINADLAEELAEKCKDVRHSGPAHLVVDLEQCSQLHESALSVFIEMHEESYSADQSLVFTGINSSVMAAFKKNEADLLLNVAPRLIEAIDIISMEILERDLLGEE